jgi:cell division protein FtsQ
MVERDRESNQHRSNSELGRARQRKLKRDGVLAGSSSENTPQTRRHSDRRSSARSESSIRERLVSTKVKMVDEELPSLQKLITSKLGLDEHNTTRSHPTGKAPSMARGTATKSAAHRRAEAPITNSPYKATQRAETQRIHVADRGGLPKKSPRVFEARSEVTPPVMVRGGMGGMAFGRAASSRARKQKAPRRRIDVPLNVTGAELRLPALPFVHLGWRAVSLLMVVMMLGCLGLIWKGPVFEVTSVQAHGLQRLTSNDLNTVMKTVGKSVFTLNPAKLDQALEQAFPELSEISVRINLPASVKVVVTERQPVIDWTQDGNEWWVDAEGISFPVRGVISDTLVSVEGHGSMPSIVAAEAQEQLLVAPDQLVSMTVPNQLILQLPHELVSAILALSEKMPADTLLVYDSDHGLGWNDPQGWEVYFGAEDQDMEMKLVVYQALVERLQSQGIQPALISVEYVHAPYYRMER